MQHGVPVRNCIIEIAHFSQIYGAVEKYKIEHKHIAGYCELKLFLDYRWQEHYHYAQNALHQHKLVITFDFYAFVPFRLGFRRVYVPDYGKYNGEQEG